MTFELSDVMVSDLGNLEGYITATACQVNGPLVTNVCCSTSYSGEVVIVTVTNG